MDVSTVDIFDPDTYVDGPPHEAFVELRRTDPVHWQEMDGGHGCWAVLKHADVSHVAKHPNVFSASLGGVVVEDLEPEQLSMMRMMLLAMDPPGHARYRRPLVPHFGRQAIASLEDRVRSICREVLAAVGDEGEFEFVHDVCAKVPSQVVGELFGIPREDWSRIQRWAEMSTSTQDDEISGGEDASSGSVQMAMYAIEFAGERRGAEPVDDLTSLILGTTFDDGPMTDVDFGSFFVQLVTAGNDTTKTMLSSGLHALLTHPDQRADVRADPSLIPGAVEEILRWANPLHYFRRTAAADTELSGTKIEAGQKVAMLYTSANRDEDVFDDPQRFDIRRQPNPHLSFGIAEHFCLGAHLARLEGRVFFEELLATFPTIELSGEPTRVRSNLNNGFKRLPVRMTRA
ncbi:MAG: cytochrome P450 [Actinobacteria bacterium]|nr:MAG: cytochrome P450 [Actinomycetota bacterium]